MSETLIDIETLPIDAAAGMDIAAHVATLPPPPAPSKYSKPESIKAWQDDPKNREEHWRRSVFDWQSVRIGCVGIMRDGIPLVLDFEDGATIADVMEHLPKSGPIYTWGTYDARVIRVACMRAGIPFGPFGVTAKPWDRRVVDLQAVVAEVVTASPRTITGISVDAVCDFFGIERHHNPIRGAGVLDAYIEGRWSDALAHCAADIRDEWAILHRLKAVW